MCLLIVYICKENKCSPNFLKQKINEIKIKYIDVGVNNCNKVDCICKKKKLNELENNLKCAFFDPNQGIYFYLFYCYINNYCTKQIIFYYLLLDKNLMSYVKDLIT